MKISFFIPTLFAVSVSFANYNTAAKNTETSCIAQNPENTILNAPNEKPKINEKTKIQVAILLDTSSSMDGLIDQAKSRLWNIVNTLTTLKYNGATPTIEIALYEYGNSDLSAAANYIRRITPLSTDLDLISEHLFALKTNGGLEYCGAVIQDATKQLEWDNNDNSMKLIYIAGNEAFDQGNIHYKETISDALKKGIYVNTIFCGNAQIGIKTFWKDGADIGKGKYFNIDSNRAIRYIETPYDREISDCNVKINATYIGYGKLGESKKTNQAVQDKNAESLSGAIYAERIVSKSTVAYTSEDWDLIEKVNKDKMAISKMKNEDLPRELQNKSKEEIKAVIDLKAKERKSIQKQISELAKKRQEYIDTEAKKSKTEDDLGNAITSSILTLAKSKGYTLK